MKEMLNHLGFPWVDVHCPYCQGLCLAYAWQAPGEAEAELTALLKLHIVDAIITEDSDAWCNNHFAPVSDMKIILHAIGSDSCLQW